MKKYNHTNSPITRIIGTTLIIATALSAFAGMLSLADASAIDGDNFQDANGTNTSVTNQVVRKGWGFMPGNGKFAIEDAPINYGITFDELPFLIVKFANSRQVADGDPVDLADCSITRNVIAAGVNQTLNGFKPILRTPTGLGFPAVTNYCYTWIAIGRHDASYDGETDPIFSGWDKSTGISVTESQISDLSHTNDSDISAMGYIKSYSETDPVFGTWDRSSGINITESQIGDLSHVTDADITAMGYIKSYTETDPEVGTNSIDYLSKWNGSALVQSAIFDNGNVGIGTADPAEKFTLSEGNFLQVPGVPKHISVITDDATIPLDGAYNIAISGKYAYVTGYLDNGVTILDISDPSNPVPVGNIVDDATTALQGARDIHVSGKYAYVTGYWDRGLEILDISDPTNPTHVGSITDDTTTELLGASGLYVSGKYAYVASYSDWGIEILDVSDPANPTHLGAIDDDATTMLYGAIDIYVSGKYAYVAAYLDGGVEILDVSDPTNPIHVGAIADDSTTELLGATSIYVSGKYAYVAAFEDDGIEILDISDPTNPTHVGSITDDGTTALDGASSIYVSGKYAYVTSYVDYGVEILDVSDPTNPVHVESITDDFTTALRGAQSIQVSGKYAYVTSAVDDSFEILDISGIEAPTASIGSISSNTLEVTENVYIGNNLYVSNGLNIGPGGVHSDGDICNKHACLGAATIETDPIFGTWDRSTGISITESQISDLTHFTTGDETDPVFSAWDKSTGINIIESQITDLGHFTNTDETDQVFTTWDKSTGISITESQISNLDHITDSDIRAMGYTKYYGSTFPGYLTKWYGSRQIESSSIYEGTFDYVGIGTTNPQSPLHVNGYIQLDTVSSTPSSFDCDQAEEAGRLKANYNNGNLYLCTAGGWAIK